MGFLGSPAGLHTSHLQAVYEKPYICLAKDTEVLL